ncbi:MAG: hypothetical protein L6R40_002039 [Gallowayella cf. fulva]|nr:MAG: hypothetical protein L6R40_002039 [Xanthomendoza cf. fulva]
MDELHAGYDEAGHGGIDNIPDQRAEFTVFHDPDSILHNERSWTDFFACSQMEGESIIDYGDRVIGLAKQLMDLDPALYDALVFHRVKAGLRGPVKDILNKSIIQPNSHAMLDKMASAIELWLAVQHTTNPGLTNGAPTTRPTITHYEDQEQAGGAVNTAPSSNFMIDPSRDPRQNGARLREELTPDDGEAQQHNQQQATSTQEDKQQQQMVDGPGLAQHSPPSDVVASSTPKIGRHQVQNASRGSQGGKRKDADADPPSHDADGQPARKKSIPFQKWSQLQKDHPVCHYCHEAGHKKDTCPTNPRNLNKAT